MRLAVDAVAEVAPGELVGRAGVELERRHRGAVLHHVDDRRRLAGLGGQQELQLVGALLHELHRARREPRRARAATCAATDPRRRPCARPRRRRRRRPCAASGTLPTSSPVAGECTSMTSAVEGSTHLPPMNSLSHSVLKLSSWQCSASWRHPTYEPSKTRTCFSQSDRGGRRTSTRLLTRNSRSSGTLRHPPAPIAGGSGGMRRPARRCPPPSPGRRRRRRRTVTTRSCSSVDGRACGHSALAARAPPR